MHLTYLSLFAFILAIVCPAHAEPATTATLVERAYTQEAFDDILGWLKPRVPSAHDWIITENGKGPKADQEALNNQVKKWQLMRKHHTATKRSRGWMVHHEHWVCREYESDEIARQMSLLPPEQVETMKPRLKAALEAQWEAAGERNSENKKLILRQLAKEMPEAKLEVELKSGFWKKNFDKTDAFYRTQGEIEIEQRLTTIIDNAKKGKMIPNRGGQSTYSW